MPQSPEELQQQYDEALEKEVLELANFKKALEEEFATKTLDDPETIAAAKAHVLDMVPSAATTLKWLLTHAASEAIRKDIAKWVMDLSMKRAEKSEEDEMLHTFLKSITKEVQNNETTTG